MRSWPDGDLVFFFPYLEWTKVEMLLGEEMLERCTAESVRPLCCQNTVPSLLESG